LVTSRRANQSIDFNASDVGAARRRTPAPLRQARVRDNG
jgi:hypothetical protein